MHGDWEDMKMRTQRLWHKKILVALTLFTLTYSVSLADEQTMTRKHQHGAEQGASSDASPTAEEQAAADKLVRDTIAGTVRFRDIRVAEAEGYRETLPPHKPARPFGRVHFINRVYIRDGKILDAERPEGLVYLKRPSGEWLYLGAMYMARKGEGPRVGGPLTPWHTHENACLATPENQNPMACPGNRKPAKQVPEMLHVWTFNNPDGPFAQHLRARSVFAAVGSEGFPPHTDVRKPVRLTER